MRCPGAPALEATCPNESTVYAAEGTVLHDIAADCLEQDLEPLDFVGQKRQADGFTFDITPELASCIRDGLDLVRDLKAGGTVFVETRVDLSVALGVDDQFGTTDVGIVDVPGRIITIFDWKFGAGIPVSPIENEQIMLYAIGFWHTIAYDLFDGDTTDVRVRLIIEQPRAPGGGGAWGLSLDELLEWGRTARAAALRAMEPDAPRIAGDKQCRMCSAAKANACPEFTAHNLALVALTFGDLDADPATPPALAPEQTLSPERRAYIVKHQAMIRRWLDSLHDSVLQSAINGTEPTPGLKLVEGRAGRRKWVDAESAETILAGSLGDKAFTRELISPAVAEKLVGKKRWKQEFSALQLTEQNPGKPVLVDEDSPKPALVAAKDKFSDLDDENDEDLI